MKRRLFWALIACGLGACGDSAPTLTEVETEVFQGSCVFSSCHQGASPAGGLNLETPSFDKLVNKPSTQDPQRMLVVPGDPDASYVVDKLLSRNLVAGTEMMPPTAALSQERIDMITSWIEAGAAND